MTDLGLDPREQLNTQEPPFGNSAYSGITEHSHQYPELAPPNTVLVDLRRDALVEIVDTVVGGTRPIGGFRAGSHKGFDTDHIEQQHYLGVRVTDCPPLNGTSPADGLEVPLLHDEPGETDLTWLSPEQLWSRILAPDGLRPLLYGTRPQSSYAETIRTGESCALSGWFDPRRPPGSQVRPFDEFTDAWPGLTTPTQAVTPTTELRLYPDLNLTFTWESAPDPDSFHIRFTPSNSSPPAHTSSTTPRSAERPTESDGGHTEAHTSPPQVTASPVPTDARAEVHISDPYDDRFDTRRALIDSPFECKQFISAGRGVSDAPDLDWDVAHPRFVRQMADELVFQNPGMDLSAVCDLGPWEYVTTTAEVMHVGRVSHAAGTTADTGSAVADVVLRDNTDTVRATLWGDHATDVAQAGPGTTVSLEGETRPADGPYDHPSHDVTLSVDTLDIVTHPADVSSAPASHSESVNKWAVDVFGDTDTVTARTPFRLSLSAVISHLTTHWGPVTLSGPLFEEIAFTSYQYEPDGPVGDPSLTPTRSHNPDPSAASDIPTTDTAGGLFLPTTDDSHSESQSDSSLSSLQAVQFSPDHPVTFAALTTHLSELHTLSMSSPDSDSQATHFDQSLPDATSAQWVPNTRLPSGTLYSFSNTETGATIRIEPALPTDNPDANSWGGEARVDQSLKGQLDSDETAQAAYRITVDEPWEDHTECVASFPCERTAVMTAITHMIALTG